MRLLYIKNKLGLDGIAYFRIEASTFSMEKGKNKLQDISKVLKRS